MTKTLTYFVSDVHLGLQVADPAAREERFVSFLKGLPQETSALYMLGDIWDFWYEYRDVVPKGYVKVFAALMELMDRGVEVYFFQGNHDIWTYSYFESLGMRKLVQPCKVEIGGKTFCLGHGDGLGPTPFGYRCIKTIFNCRPLQVLFSMLIHGLHIASAMCGQRTAAFLTRRSISSRERASRCTSLPRPI